MIIIHKEERNNHMKKIVVLLLALCMIFMLCACGEEAVQEVVSDSAEAEAVTNFSQQCRLLGFMKNAL